MAFNIFITNEGIDNIFLNEQILNQFKSASWKIVHDIKSVKNLLVVPGNACFSSSALTALQDLLEDKTNPCKIIDSTKNTLLATYFPESMTSTADIAEISGETIEGGTLDHDHPPFLVTDLVDVTKLEKNIFYERACQAILAGVKIRDPHGVSIRGELSCGKNVEIDTNVIFEGKVILGDGVKIGANSIVINSHIGNETRINPFSIVEDAIIGSKSFVGPYGRVRPGSKLGDSVQIGNFVEIKKSQIGAGSRINHLSFVGDATLENDVTIGAGCITCNHTGSGPAETKIGAGAYIGSGCELVAPLTIGKNATIGAGSTITENVPADKLTLARVRQNVVENWKRK